VAVLRVGVRGIILLDAALLVDWLEWLQPRWIVAVVAPLRLRWSVCGPRD